MKVNNIKFPKFKKLREEKTVSKQILKVITFNFLIKILNIKNRHSKIKNKADLVRFYKNKISIIKNQKVVISIIFYLEIVFYITVIYISTKA